MTKSPDETGELPEWVKDTPPSKDFKELESRFWEFERFRQELHLKYGDRFFSYYNSHRDGEDKFGGIIDFSLIYDYR